MSILFPVITALYLFSCQTEIKHKNQPNITTTNSEDAHFTGKKIALKVCGNCHLFPEPQLLDKSSWQKQVLPQMSLYLGIYYDGESYQSKIPESFYEQNNLGKLAKSMKLYPDSALISLQAWLQVENYYYSQAPNQLSTLSEGTKRLSPSPVFTGQFPSFSMEKSYASTTMLEFDPVSRLIYFGDKRTAKLYILNDKFQVIDQYATGSAPMKVMAKGQKLYVLTIGTFEAKESQEGKLLLIENGKIDTILKELERPVDFVMADLTGDENDEIIIAAFGSLRGSLAWYQKTKTGYKKNILYDGPGSIVLYPKDLNNDGKTDIAALISHGKEGVVFYINEGGGNFKQQNVIEMPPVYGSTHFSFSDMNGDGLEDIIYVNGDNADLSPVVKPYHGVRIFLNKGDFHFQEDQFIPINGAYKAIANDFNQDGLLDLAVVSFFPDFTRQPEESFVLLVQEPNLSFTAHLVPEAREGRWITMTSGDFSGDGKAELLLGAHLLSQGPPVPTYIRNLWAKKKRTFLHIQYKP